MELRLPLRLPARLPACRPRRSPPRPARRFLGIRPGWPSSDRREHNCTRSDDDRILIQIVGVDEDFRVHGKSGGDGEQILKDLPSGATLRVKIIALNGSLEAADGPVAEISVP